MSGVDEMELDAYRPCPGGVYRSETVTVRRQPLVDQRRLGITRTAHFDVGRVGTGLLLEHDLGAGEVSDDISGQLSEELFDAGWIRGPELFEELLVGIVLTCAETPQQAWLNFYRNTLRRIDEEIAEPSGRGSIAAYAPVHEHVQEVIRGTAVHELGTCFGFQALRLARAGLEITASDLSAEAVHLLLDMSRLLDLPVRTLVADAARLTEPDGSFDTVLAIHLLEHVPDDTAVEIIREACRMARRRVVVAVPFEEEPSQQFGHLRSLTLADLRTWVRGAGTDWDWRVYEHHGGWLLLDRPT
ncbi:mycofactocin oligosaccharide methyltransferase MftM [Flexivirga caeni]|uniref:Class I SAM-dependent methyltransferase n=1 Tax=Flexivirga caeni TaxID=2294115 RepID=A0A3M9M2R1_9MICO|nr:mycofactocin oligosaccharide methyltransferase MftM [Flexivirga caeni]RNI19840.1 class I SAM-dependent methyltransferase [Flexivirga caeni]